MAINLWLRGSVLVNPYYRTAFHVGRVPREVVRHKTVVQLIGQTRQLVNTGAGAHRVNGAPVSSTDVNAAETVLLDPLQRIHEELLVHAAEKVPLEHVRRLQGQVIALMEPGEIGTPFANATLRLWQQALLEEYLNASSPPSPSFGALELEPQCPLWQAEEDE